MVITTVIIFECSEGNFPKVYSASIEKAYAFSYRIKAVKQQGATPKTPAFAQKDNRAAAKSLRPFFLTGDPETARKGHENDPPFSLN